MIRARVQCSTMRRLRCVRWVLALWCLAVVSGFAATSLSGRVLDPGGGVVPGATIRLIRLADSSQVQTRADSEGQFSFGNLDAGDYSLMAEFPGFTPATRTLALADEQGHTENLKFVSVSPQTESVIVTAGMNEINILSPDPGERVLVRQDLPDANPGRPGAPVSIPGVPIETASGGIKAPQYFAPGVAGDHGESIAQFIAVGGYLVPNNLSGNAHGNGYADPNIFVPQVIGSVQVDGGAFNVREGNHAVNLAATYGLRSHLDPFLTLTADQRDIDLTTGFSNGPESWLAFEASYGNGFLDRMEHRRQYKINAQQSATVGTHRLTFLGLGYYGQSYLPGLVPILAPDANDVNLANLGDTIDPRQQDQTHTTLLALNDVWQLHGQQVQLSGFLRTYNLALDSDFGHGLIRQSEFRTVGGASAEYLRRFAECFSLLGGLDYEREAPRRDNLDRYGFFDPRRPAYYGPFTPVDASNVTIASVTPHLAAEGGISHHFHYYLGWRTDMVSFENRDLLTPQNSFNRSFGVNSPKATFSFTPGASRLAPLVGLSFGDAFFTEDPRIGLGNMPGTAVAKARSYQLRISKAMHGIDLRLTLGHVTKSAELAKIDPDTGLQSNEGPSRLRFITLAMRRSFGLGSIQTSLSKADARDLDSGSPTPEAPRTVFDFLGTVEKLPLHVEAKVEFEVVGRKPLGTGCDLRNLNAECVGTPVKEFRSALVRPFLNGRVDAGVNFMIAQGYTGQTTENFFPSDTQEVVGVRIPSYASLSFTYRFGNSR